MFSTHHKVSVLTSGTTLLVRGVEQRLSEEVTKDFNAHGKVLSCVIHTRHNADGLNSSWALLTMSNAEETSRCRKCAELLEKGYDCTPFDKYQPDTNEGMMLQTMTKAIDQVEMALREINNVHCIKLHKKLKSIGFSLTSIYQGCLDPNARVSMPLRYMFPALVPSNVLSDLCTGGCGTEECSHRTDERHVHAADKICLECLVL